MTPRPDTGSLAALLAQATPGPWTVSYGASTGEPHLSLWGGQGYCLADDSFHYGRRGDYDLIALAPAMARLLVDMAAYVSFHSDNVARDLSTRFAVLDEKAGGA